MNNKIMNKFDTLSIVLATIAGFMMIAATMFFSVAQTAMINNNAIGIEDAKFMYEHNTSLKNYGEIDRLIVNDNKIAESYGNLVLGFFGIAIILGIIAVVLAYPRDS